MIKKIGIVGGSGYTGGELIRILINHPNVEIDFVYSRTNDGKKIHDIHSDLIGKDLPLFSKKINKNIDVVFLCLGHGNSSKFLKENFFLKKTVIIDLSNDFRLKSNNSFKDLNFIYGLPELNRENIKKGKAIANPGCFASLLQLALLPLAENGLLEEEIHANATTGSTGAGVGMSETSHFSWRNNNLTWYKAFNHQHLDEIIENIKFSKINLIPQRGNFTRGIFLTCYTKFKYNLNYAKKIFEDYYKDEPFTIISKNEITLKQVINTNNCVLHLHKYKEKLLITGALDNLLKGASGQAIQNLNIIMGWSEKLGLEFKANIF